MNVVTLIGRLTKDVEIRYTQNGNANARFTLAVNRRVASQNGERQADFINCVIWNKPAEILAQYTRKGSQIGVQGRIQTGSYQNEQGQRIYTTDIIVENFDFLDSRNSGNENSSSTFPQSTQQFTAPQNTTSINDDFDTFDISDNDLPF